MKEIPNHVIRPATAVMLTNQPKTRPDPALMPMYAKVENNEQKIIDTKGNPLRAVFIKILGALPATARPSTRSVSNDFKE